MFASNSDADLLIREIATASWVQDHAHADGVSCVAETTPDGPRVNIDGAAGFPVVSTAGGLAVSRSGVAFWSNAEGGDAVISVYRPESGAVVYTRTRSTVCPSLTWWGADALVTSLHEAGVTKVVRTPAEEGGEPTTIVELPQPEFHDPVPQISPDGDLLYANGSSEEQQILLLRRGASAPVPLFRSRRNTTLLSYRQSPDGSQVALVVGRSFGNELRILELAGGMLEVVDLDRPTADIAWSPDGTRLAVLQEGWPASRVAVADMRTREVTTADPVAGTTSTAPRWIADKSIGCVLTGPGLRPTLFSADIGDDGIEPWKPVADALREPGQQPVRWAAGPAGERSSARRLVISGPQPPAGYLLVRSESARTSPVMWTPITELALRSGFSVVVDDLRAVAAGVVGSANRPGDDTVRAEVVMAELTRSGMVEDVPPLPVLVIVDSSATGSSPARSGELFRAPVSGSGRSSREELAEELHRLAHRMNELRTRAER